MPFLPTASCIQFSSPGIQTAQDAFSLLCPFFFHCTLVRRPLLCQRALWFWMVGSTCHHCDNQGCPICPSSWEAPCGWTISLCADRWTTVGWMILYIPDRSVIHGKYLKKYVGISPKLMFNFGMLWFTLNIMGSDCSEGRFKQNILNSTLNYYYYEWLWLIPVYFA